MIRDRGPKIIYPDRLERVAPFDANDQHFARTGANSDAGDG